MAQGSAGQGDGARDRVVIADRVLTMYDDAPEARAVAIRDGRILAVGSVDTARAAVAADAEILEFPGATALPGINDSHGHTAHWGASRPPLALDLTPAAVGSIADIAAAVRGAAAAAPAGTWIRGVGWDSGALRECLAEPGRRPTRHDLDAAAPDHPVALYDFSLHALWVNSKAIELAGVTAGTAAPAGGELVRDEHGEPTGLFSEFPAQDLIHQHMPVLTRDDRRAAILSATAALHALGITSVTEAALGPGGGSSMLGLETLHAYEDLLDDGALALRVSVLLMLGADGGATAADVERGLRDVSVRTSDERWLREAGVKIFGDGIPPLKTAWLHEPYAGDTARGALVIPGADDAERVRELTEMVRLAHAAGRQVGIHSTGDATIDAVVAAYVAAVQAHPRSDPRHYVIHADLASDATLATMAAHGFGANIQPQIKAMAADLMALLLGPERSARQWPSRSALDAGVPLAYSSDLPVCFPDWRQGVAAAVLRQSNATGEVSGPEERVTVVEALRAYTTAGAWQDFAEDWKGTLAAGQVADLCVVGGDLLATPAEEIPAIPIVATLLDGDTVFAA